MGRERKRNPNERNRERREVKRSEEKKRKGVDVTILIKFSKTETVKWQDWDRTSGVLKSKGRH